MTNTKNLITENIDLWTSALKNKSGVGRGSSKKLNLYGIKKLRELILELAVRGKLVPQDPTDEPASKLLKRIAEEKAVLVKEGKIKKQKPIPELTSEDITKPLPLGWSYARFGNVTFNRDAERIPLSVTARRTRQGEYDYYGASSVIDKIDDFLFDKTLLLIGEDGANLINRSTPIAFLAHGKYWVNNHAHVLDGITIDFLRYIELHINAISLELYITGTAQPKMNQAKMNTIVLSIPPENEQKRIVAKVDELMALCDQLESQTEMSIAAHETLVETLLSTLTESKNSEELSENWSRIAMHFETLFTTESSIDKLKQTVLQLAIMGKLVRENEKPKYFKISDLISFGPRNGLSPKEVKVATGIKVFKLGATSKGFLDLAESKFVDIKISQDSHLWLKKDDILIQRGNAAKYVGCNLLIKDDLPGYIYPDLMMKIQLNDLIDPEFASLSLSAPASRKMMWDGMTGTSGTMPKISKKVVEKVVLRVPPLVVQFRIVKKVNDLTALCNQLKEHISESKNIQKNFADAIIQQVVG